MYFFSDFNGIIVEKSNDPILKSGIIPDFAIYFFSAISGSDDEKMLG